MRPSRRQLIGLIIAAVLISAYAIAGFFAVPRFARQGAVDFVRTHYGRTLTIGDVRFNPFTLDLDVTGVSLPDADGKPMLAFRRLQVDLQWATLWRLGPSFGTVLLERPYVRAVVRPDGALNLADLGKGFEPAPPPPGKQPLPPAKPMRLYVGRLAVIAGTTEFEDRSRATPFHADFAPIAFELRDFSTRADTGDAYTLDATSQEGERLHWAGTVRLAPLSSHGTFVITDLKARTLWSYLRASLPFEIDAGVIALNGDYDVSSAGGPLGLKVDVRKTTVSGLALKPAGGSEDYVALGTLEVDDTRLDLGRRAVEVAKVQLAGGDIKAWLSEQGRLNVLDLLGPQSPAAGAAAGATGSSGAAAPPPPAAPTGASSSWALSVPDISVSALKVSAEDRQVTPAAAVVLDPLNIHVGGFNLSPDDVLDITLDSAVNTSGRIAAHGTVTPRSGVVAAHLEAEHLGLAALQPLLAQYTSMTLLKGELGTRVDFARHADGSLEIKGDTRVRDLRTVDNALRNDFIRWRDLAIAEVSYRSQPARLRIASVTLVEPYARVIIAPNQTLNIKAVLTPPGAAAQPAAVAPAAPRADPAPPRKRARGKSAPPPAAPPKPLAPFPVSIGTVRVLNGAANYTDLWIKPSFSISMQSLNGAVTGLSSDPASRAKVQLDGKVEQYSPVTIAGEVNLLSAALYSDIKLGFKDVDLTIVNPYSGHFVGYKIDKGKLSVDVSYHIEQRRLSAVQHFVIDELDLGERVESPDAVHLPLKIAVALLKDRNGLIDLDLPMSGSIDDPSFRIGPIIWKMVVNLIVKVATAPFALLGHLFGGGEHMNILEFAAGSAALDKAAQDQLAGLRKALAERPQLKLDVPIVTSARLDRPQLARAQLDRELQQRAQGTRQGRKQPEEAAQTALADPATHLKLLIEQFHATLGKDAALPPSVVAVQEAKKKEAPPLEPAIADLETALLARIEVPDSDLDALGKDRARAIQDALLSGGQVEAARVFVVNAAPKPDSGSTVKVELAVH